MKPLLCLLAALSLARAQPGYNGAALYTLQDIRDLADSIEASTRDLYDGINTLTALNALATGRIQDVQDFFLPSIALVNSQQSQRGEAYTVQIKGLQHRVDEALSQAAASNALGAATRDELQFQIDDFVNGTFLATLNDEQQVDLDELTPRAALAKERFLDNLNNTLDTLEGEREAVADKIDILGDFIDFHRCSAGQGAFLPDTDTYVTYLLPFERVDGVVVSITGWEAELGAHSYDQYEGLALEKFVSNVSTSGFTLSTRDTSQGNVRVTRIFCSYLACQGGGVENVNIHP